MRHAVFIVASLLLAGCNAGAGDGPDVRAQVAPDFSAAIQRYSADLKLARQHRMTYVAAAQRLRQGAMAAPGAVLSGPDNLLISYIVAMSAEVDAGRMTPEMLVFKMQERVQQNETEARQQNAAQQQQRLQKLQAYTNYLNATRPPQIVEAPPPAWPTPPVIGGSRLQTTCTTMPLGGGLTNTTCQ